MVLLCFHGNSIAMQHVCMNREGVRTVNEHQLCRERVLLGKGEFPRPPLSNVAKTLKLEWAGYSKPSNDKEVARGRGDLENKLREKHSFVKMVQQQQNMADAI